MMTNLKFTLAYVASIVAVNIGFMVVPMVLLARRAPMSLLVEPSSFCVTLRRERLDMAS